MVSNIDPTLNGQLDAQVDVDKAELKEQLQAAADEITALQAAAVVFGGAGSDGLVPDPETESGAILRDDGTWVAKTSFAWSAVPINENTTLNKDSHSGLFLDSSYVMRYRTLIVQHSTTPSSPVLLTLPSAAAGDGAFYVFVVPESQTGLVTIQRAGSDLIDGLTSIPMGLSNRATAILSNIASGAWRYEGDSTRRVALPAYDEPVTNAAPSAGAVTLDFGAAASAVGNFFTSSISEAITSITVSNGSPASGFARPFVWRISADGTNRSVTVPGGWVRLGGWVNPFTVLANGHAVVAGHVNSGGTVFASLALTT